MPQKKSKTDDSDSPVPWRMSPLAKKVLKDVADQTGMSRTQVLEVCVAKHALELPALSEALKKDLVELVSRNLVQDQNKK